MSVTQLSITTLLILLCLYKQLCGLFKNVVMPVLDPPKMPTFGGPDMYPSSFLKSLSNEVYKYSSDMNPRPSNGRGKINNYSSIPSKLRVGYMKWDKNLSKISLRSYLQSPNSPYH